MANKPKNHGKDWTSAEDNAIRTKARSGMPTEEIAEDLGRTEAAVRSEASRKGITLRPVDPPQAGPGKKG